MTTPPKKRRQKLISVVVQPGDEETIQWLDDKVYWGVRNKTMDAKMDRSKLIMAILKARKAQEEAMATATETPAAVPAPSTDPALRKK